MRRPDSCLASTTLSSCNSKTISSSFMSMHASMQKYNLISSPLTIKRHLGTTEKMIRSVAAQGIRLKTWTPLAKTSLSTLMLPGLTRGFQTAIAARSSSKPKGSVSSLFDAVMSEAKEIQKNVPDKASNLEPLSTAKEALEKPAADAIKLPTFTTGRFKGSHRKVNHLTRLIQGMSLQEAHTQMSMNLKRPAENVRKMLHRVMAALRHNYNLDPARYYIQRAWVGKESHRKAINIHGRGRMGIITHPFSHVKIALGERDPNPSKEDKEVAQLVQIFRRTKPFVHLEETRPLQFAHPVWSRKPWKYVTSPKWIDSSNALRKLEK